MALMFPRLARNFAKNGYYPTDEPTLERALNALMPSDGPMCILDPCAGEGVAIAEASHALGREQTKAFAVEFDAERARHARGLVDHCLHADLMDTMISKQSFGLLWLNPPYGDLSKDVNGNIGYQGQGRPRLEKLFYQRSLSLLQYGGVEPELLAQAKAILANVGESRGGGDCRGARGRPADGLRHRRADGRHRPGSQEGAQRQAGLVALWVVAVADPGRHGAGRDRDRGAAGGRRHPGHRPRRGGLRRRRRAAGARPLARDGAGRLHDAGGRDRLR